MSKESLQDYYSNVVILEPLLRSNIALLDVYRIVKDSTQQKNKSLVDVELMYEIEQDEEELIQSIKQVYKLQRLKK